MSPRNSKPAAPPQMDIFVALLMVSTVCLIIGCAFMWLVLQDKYQFLMP